jgi:hypothetical protein
MVEIANKVSLAFDKCFCANKQSQEQWSALTPLVH